MVNLGKGVFGIFRNYRIFFLLLDDIEYWFIFKIVKVNFGNRREKIILGFVWILEFIGVRDVFIFLVN